MRVAGLLLLGASGGCSLVDAIGDLECTSACGTWAEVASIANPRGSAVAVALGSDVYVLGGRTSATEGATALATVERYNPTLDRWDLVAPMPEPRFEFAGVASGGRIYVFGGSGNVHTYDPSSDMWQPLAPEPRPTSRGGAGEIAGVVYVLDGSDQLAGLDAYTLGTDSWTQRATPQRPRGRLGTAAVDGKLYAVSGAVPLGSSLADVDAYDPSTDSWSERASIPSGRSNLGVVALDGYVYAIGGCCDEGAINGGQPAAVERYDPASDTWSVKAHLPIPVVSPAVAAADGHIYVIGGFREQEFGPPMTNVQVFTP